MWNYESGINGFWIPRKNIIFGKWIEHAGWYPDPQLRLFRNGKGKFPEEHVHEMVKVEGDVGHMKNNIVHHNYESISQFLNKVSTIYGPNGIIGTRPGTNFRPRATIIIVDRIISSIVIHGARSD